MIPPISSSLPLRVRRQQTTDQDDAKMVAREPEALTSDRDEATFCSGNATIPAEVSYNVVRRKRVTFADDEDQGATPDIALHRSPTGAKRRRRSTIWNATVEQHTDLVDQSEQHRSNAKQSLSSNSYTHDVSGRSIVMSSSDDEDLLQTNPQTAALPSDPRQWTRSDVHVWLRQTTRLANLSNHSHHHQQQQQPIDVDFERFRMNGKALCLMSSDMFAYRVPLGGHLLYKDFQARLCRAVAESLHRHCSVG